MRTVRTGFCILCAPCSLRGSRWLRCGCAQSVPISMACRSGFRVARWHVSESQKPPRSLRARALDAQPADAAPTRLRADHGALRPPGAPWGAGTTRHRGGPRARVFSKISLSIDHQNRNSSRRPRRAAIRFAIRQAASRSSSDATPSKHTAPGGGRPDHVQHRLLSLRQLCRHARRRRPTRMLCGQVVPHAFCASVPVRVCGSRGGRSDGPTLSRAQGDARVSSSG